MARKESSLLTADVAPTKYVIRMEGNGQAPHT